MGITLLHFWICYLLIGAANRSVTYLLLNSNPDSRVAKFLAYAG
jgi:hypothetical protein